MAMFMEQLRRRCHECGNPVLVGLDPRLESLPMSIRPVSERASAVEVAAAYGTFCRAVIDVVAPLVPAVKPQSAFFEQLGPVGITLLVELIRYAQSKGLLVILDGKRNDIGSTAAAYADGMLGRGDRSAWGADALTVSPYLGEDGVQPFVDIAARRNAGVFVLVKTSNPGGMMLQDLTIAGWTPSAEQRWVKSADVAVHAGHSLRTASVPVHAGSPDGFVGRSIYERMGAWVDRLAASAPSADDVCYGGVVGAVVGATYPEELAALRAMMPATWFLVPGFGAQGGGVGDVAAAFDKNGEGAIVNNSRGIIFAYRSPEYAGFGESRWESAVEAATRKMIDSLRDGTTAGRLGHR